VVRAGWERILFNQFHDILPGSSIAQVYADARAEYHEVFQRGEGVRAAALDAIAAAVHTPGPSLVAFNPAPFAREDPVEVLLPAGTPLPTPSDPEGRPVAVQELGRDEAGVRVLVGMAAPPLGYRAHSLAGPHPPGVRAERRDAA